MIRKFCQNPGFTLIELLIATAILSILTMLSTSAYNGYIAAAKISRAIHEIRALSVVINAYGIEYGQYPVNLAQIGNDLLTDPWGNNYVYLNLKLNNRGASRKDGNLVPINTHYDLYSFGKDGKSKPPLRAAHSHDDVIYAADGGYIGIAEKF